MKRFLTPVLVLALLFAFATAVVAGTSAPPYVSVVGEKPWYYGYYGVRQVDAEVDIASWYDNNSSGVFSFGIAMREDGPGTDVVGAGFSQDSNGDLVACIFANLDGDNQTQCDNEAIPDSSFGYTLLVFIADLDSDGDWDDIRGVVYKGASLPIFQYTYYDTGYDINNSSPMMKSYDFWVWTNMGGPVPDVLATYTEFNWTDWNAYTHSGPLSGWTYFDCELNSDYYGYGHDTGYGSSDDIQLEGWGGKIPGTCEY